MIGFSDDLVILGRFFRLNNTIQSTKSSMIIVYSTLNINICQIQKTHRLGGR